MKQTKRCSICKRVIRDHNKSGMCAYHAMLENRKISRRKKNE